VSQECPARTVYRAYVPGNSTGINAPAAPLLTRHCAQAPAVLDYSRTQPQGDGGASASVGGRRGKWRVQPDSPRRQRRSTEYPLGPSEGHCCVGSRASRDHGHGVTRSRRKPPRRLCSPTSPLGRSDRPLALLLSSLFSCSETLLSRFLVASLPVQDLLLSAKYLFGAAKIVWHAHKLLIRGIAGHSARACAGHRLQRVAPVALSGLRCHLQGQGTLAQRQL